MEPQDLTTIASIFENIDSSLIKVEYLFQKEHKKDDLQQIHISRRISEDIYVGVTVNFELTKLLVGLAQLPQAKELANVNQVLWIIKNFSFQVISNNYLAEDNLAVFIKFIEKQSNISKFDL